MRPTSPALLFVAVAASALAATACSERSSTLIIGADDTFATNGFAHYLQAAFEEKTKQRTKLVLGDSLTVQKMAERGVVDVVLLGSDGAIERLKADGVAVRVEPVAHEEFVFIGPVEDQFRAHGSSDPVEFLKNVTRSNYVYMIAADGTPENDRHKSLERRTGDRPGAGNHRQSRKAGVELVKEIVGKKAFGLVKRSAVVLAATDGVKPNRVYQDGRADLVLGMFAAEVHPGKTKRQRNSAFVDFLLGEDGRKIVEKFGSERFGLPLFGAGLPPAGEGAKVPGLDLAPEGEKVPQSATPPARTVKPAANASP